MYVQQNLNEFDHGSDWTGTTELFALELGKIAAFDFVYSLASTNILNTKSLVILFLFLQDLGRKDKYTNSYINLTVILLNCHFCN